MIKNTAKRKTKSIIKKGVIASFSCFATLSAMVPMASAKTYTFKKTDTKFIAHAGYAEKAADKNTEKSFVQAGKAGFWGCETDIRETKDHVLVCAHHDSCDKKGVSIKNMTWNTLKKKVPDITSYGTYLRLCVKYKMLPVIDLKAKLSDTGYKKLFDYLYTNKYKSKGNYNYFVKNGKKIEFTKEAQLSSLYLTGKKYKGESVQPTMISPTVNYCKKHYDTYKVKKPVTMYFVNTKRLSEMKNAKSLCNKYGLSWIGLRAPQMNKDYANYCKKNKIKMNVWYETGYGKESPARLHKLIHEFNVDSVSTNEKWW